MGARPNLFLVGVQRSATTAMWQYLGEHPDIYMGPKEIHYFGSDLGTFGTEVDAGHRPDLSEYLSLFSSSTATAARIRGDASVGYIYSATAASEIHQFDPGARVVASFRNPVDMAWSLYGLMRHQGAEPAAEFEEAFRDAAHPRWAYTHYPFRWAFTYPKLIRFAEQLERYLEVFGPDQVHVIVYEDVRRDAAGEYDRVLRFLDVPAGFRPDFTVVNAQRRTRSTVLRRWLEHTPRGLRHAGRVLVPSQRARRKLGRSLTDHNERTATGATAGPSLDPVVRARLEAEVAGEVERFGALIGRDLRRLWLPSLARADGSAGSEVVAP
jgi:hypothetical protein